MTRKQTNYKKKISIDFTPKSIELIEKAKCENYDGLNKISNSLIINDVLENTLGCPAPLKKDIVRSLSSLLGSYHLQRLTNTNNNTFLNEGFSEFEKHLEKLITIFGGQNLQKWYDSEKTRLVQMASGRTIRIPTDWIVLNEGEAEEYTDAFVLECSNSYYYGLPHFLMFYDHRAYDRNDKSSYSMAFKTLFYNLVLQVYPDFQMVLDNQVETRVVNGRVEGLDEWGKAPIISIFRIKNSHDLKRIRLCEKNYVPPMGIFVDIPE